MSAQTKPELDLQAENIAFEREAARLPLSFEKLPGGFYVDQRTQFAWALWIDRAVIALDQSRGESQQRAGQPAGEGV